MTALTKENIFLKGLRDGIPIAMGYYAVGFSLGIVAGNAGLTALGGFITSFFTRASAGEYGAYTLIAAAASYVELALMCVVTNLRYLLMSTALSQKFSKSTSMLKRALVSLCITDEVFGISIAYPGKLAPSYTFGAAIISTLFWALGSMSGIVAGNVLPANIVSAFSVALYGMFLAIIVPPARRDKAVGVAVAVSFALSGLCAVLPWVSQLSGGTRTIILTLLISAVAALLKPIDDKEEEEEAQ